MFLYPQNTCIRHHIAVDNGIRQGFTDSFALCCCNIFIWLAVHIAFNITLLTG